MKLLTRLAGVGLGRSTGGLISFVNRELERPLFQQSRRRMGTHPSPSPSPSPSPAADQDTRWTILERWFCATDSTAADVVAAAETKTSSGSPLRVSLSRAAPPAISFLCFDWAGHGRKKSGGGKQSPADNGFSHAVVAAHGDSVHLSFGGDNFVYRAAAGGGHPPSLSLLPACKIPMYRWDLPGDYDSGEVYRTERVLDQMDTGLLRLAGGGEDDGAGEFVVAQLLVAYEAPFDTAELCVIRRRPGRGDKCEWEFHGAVPIVHHDGGGGGRRHDLGRWQELSAAVPAGNRFLCWVSYDHSTLLVCDMAAAAAATESPKLRYVPLPVKAVPPKVDEWDDDDDDDEHEHHLPWLYYRTIGSATPPPPPPPGTDDTAAAAVRFVSIDRRCCCGAPVVRSACEHSGSAFTVTTWTLALRPTTGDDDDGDEPTAMAWVKEGVLDCEEFWALLAGYDDDGDGRRRRLRRRAWPTCPVVSPENPDVVCFVVAEVGVDGETKGTIWTVEVDTRRKTLISAVPCPRHPVRCVNYCNHLPAKLDSSLLN